MCWTLLFHNFARTLCFHALFHTVFWTIRWFIVKNRYFHVLFCLDYMKVNLATWKREKKRGLGSAPMQNPVFLQSFWSASFQNPMFLRSFWLNLVSPRPSGLPPGLQYFLEKHAKNWVLETWARKNTWKHRVLHQGLAKTSFFPAYSCRQEELS